MISDGDKLAVYLQIVRLLLEVSDMSQSGVRRLARQADWPLQMHLSLSNHFAHERTLVFAISGRREEA